MMKGIMGKVELARLHTTHDVNRVAAGGLRGTATLMRLLTNSKESEALELKGNVSRTIQHMI